MRIPRIYIDQELNIDTIITLPKENATHIISALKRKAGDKIILFNNINTDGEFLSEIIDYNNQKSNKNKLFVKILEFNNKLQDHASINPKTKIELAQCISKPNHFEVTLQKSVELGVDIITPIISSRSEQKLNSDNISSKISRWQKIIISAAEQSGRCDLPVLQQPIHIDQWIYNLIQNNNDLLLALCTKSNNNLTNLLKNNNNIINNIKIIIGPEGGLDNEEINLLKNNKFKLIKLGNNIFRTETASIVILSILQFFTNWQ